MKSNAYANRGMGLETLIEYANEQYAKRGIANIQKISTPWQIVRQGKQIVSAYPTGPSTVDYMGECGGKAICFEAKQTMNSTRFPLANFEVHQIEFMDKWRGRKFALIEFTSRKQIYYCSWAFLSAWWSEYEGQGRKSIPWESFNAMCPVVSQGNGIALDYLKHVEGIT